MVADPGSWSGRFALDNNTDNHQLAAASHERITAPLEKSTRTLIEPFREFINALSASARLLMAALLLAVGLAN